MENDNKSRILVVEDNLQNIQVIGTIIRKMGMSLFVANNGKEALKILENVKPLLIISDIMMPEMDGFELCRHIKHRNDTKNIPVIFLTASNDEEQEVKGLELGAVDFLRKPICAPVLEARVNTHINLENAKIALEQQNELLKENARLKDEVERITRHDLKNPLQAFISVPELLLYDENLTVDQRDMLSDLQNSAYKMLDMIDKSLDIYKMEVGSYQVSLAEVNLCRVLERIRNHMRFLIIRKETELIIIVDGKCLEDTQGYTILGEDLLYYSMLSNLVKNAIEATPVGKTITITVETKKSFLRIIIENAGTVPENVKDHFFDKYSTSGKEKGTGLGTYSAQLIAKTLKGDIRVDTSQSDRVRVIIDLPFKHIFTNNH